MTEMPFSNPWTESEPTDATYVREVDDWIRRLSTAVRERLQIEHYVYQTESGQQNIGKHKPGSAKILAGLAASKPSPDPSAPGTIYYETDTGRLLYDTGSAWAVLSHKNMHKTGGDDPIAPSDIGAVAKSGDSMTGPLSFSLSLPSGVVNSDTPDKWPASGIALYAVGGAGLLQYQPASQGVVLHIGLSYVRFQLFFNWTHPGSQQPPGSFWWRHAGDGDLYWSAWATLWNSLNDGPGSGSDADLLDGLQPSSDAVANTVVSRDASGDIKGRVLHSTVATGAAPLVVASTTKVGNLNVDKLDGWDADSGTTANTIPVRDANGKVPGSITGDSDTVDGKHANDQANQIALYDANRRVYDSNRLVGMGPSVNADANTIAQRDGSGDLTARVLKATTFLQLPVLTADPVSPPNGAVWMRA